MAGQILDWHDDLERWLEPFLGRLGHKARQRMCPLYIAGLIGPGERKSVQPMAERLAAGSCIISSRPTRGMLRRWRLYCLSRQTDLSAAMMRSW
jgi:hypothetical protein